MTMWMAWSMLVSTLVAVAVAALERAVARLGLSRRFIWVGGLLAATIGPVAIAVRPATSAEGPSRLGSTFDVGLGRLPPGPAIRRDVIPARGPSSWLTRIRNGVEGPAVVIDRWGGRGWLAMSLGSFALLVGAVRRVDRRRRLWLEADTEVGRVLLAADYGPAVVGVLHPTIVIPRWALVADGSTRAMILRHEQEHLRANDSRVLFGATMLLAAFPWNPAIWWLVRRLRLAIEIDCDGRVIRAMGAAHVYGHMLVNVAERYAEALPLSALLSEPDAHLEARIHAMTMPRARRPVFATLPFALLTLGVLVAVAWTPLPASLRAIRERPAAASRDKGQGMAPPPAATPTMDTEPPPPWRQKSRSARRMRISTAGSPITLAMVDPKPLPGNRAPTYPPDMREARAEGSVSMTFSTDARGVPDIASIQVIESTNDAFAASVRAVVPLWRFDSPGTARLVVRFVGIDGATGEPTRVTQPLTARIQGLDVWPVIVQTVFDAPARRPPG